VGGEREEQIRCTKKIIGKGEGKNVRTRVQNSLSNMVTKRLCGAVLAVISNFVKDR
jgi:hypothetical protein